MAAVEGADLEEEKALAEEWAPGRVAGEEQVGVQVPGAIVSAPRAVPWFLTSLARPVTR